MPESDSFFQTSPRPAETPAIAAGPRTTARPIAEGNPDGRSKRTGRRPPRFVVGLMGELFPIRPYPLDVTSYTRVLIEALREHMFGPLGVHCPLPEEEFVEREGVVVQVDFAVRPTLAMLYRPWLTLWRNRRYDLTHWHDDPVIAEAIRRSRELEARDLTTLSWGELVGTLDDALAITPLVARLRHHYLPQAIRDLLILWLLLAVTGQRRHFSELQTGVETKTLEMNRALVALAARVIANPELHDIFTKTPARDLLAAIETCPAASDFLAAFRAFLDGFGHRETVLTLASQPAWRNAPEIPLGVIQGMVAADTSVRSVDQPDGSAESRSRWQEARDEILARSVLGREPLRTAFLRALREARRFPRLREDTHFFLTLGLPAVYTTLQELGRRLQAVRALDEPRDVFHLKLAELKATGRPWPPADEAVGRIRALVARRAATRAALADVPLLGDTLPVPFANVEGAIVAGLAGSPGIAEGPVRVIQDSSQFGLLRSGDVLVAPFTSPAWTPLFQRAAAIVVDSGGALSHAAVVAREYRIPAVLATVDATRRLQNGQRVRVDGTRGLVFRVPTP